jgi:8-oxoguanine deaminase
VMFDLRQIGFAGALHDPVAALVFCTPANVACSVINGRVVVREGRCVTVETEVLCETHQRLARELVQAAR